MFITSLFTITNLWKQPKYPTVGEWIKQLPGIYQVAYYLATKKEKIVYFLTAWMDLEDFMSSVISQLEKEKYHMILLICGINEQTELTSKIETDS